MSANRPTQFRQALDAIHRRWGSEALRPLAALSDSSAFIPTGYSELDKMISGGIPCGQITELSGVPTCGVTTLALKVVAQAQLQGRLGVYIDLARSFDPGYAVHCGVQLDGLLIARPEDPADALDILQIVAEEGGAGLAVLDPLPQQAALRLALENTGWIENTRDICGCRARVTVIKDRRSHPDRHSDIEILLDEPVQGEVA